MKVLYRVVEERNRHDVWEVVGVITFWESDPPHMQLRSSMQHTVSRSTWRKIQERAQEGKLTLETFHEAMHDFARDYRLLPEIHSIERETAAEIRQFLRDTYVYGPTLEAA